MRNQYGGLSSFSYSRVAEYVDTQFISCLSIAVSYMSQSKRSNANTDKLRKVRRSSILKMIVMVLTTIPYLTLFLKMIH